MDGQLPFVIGNSIFPVFAIIGIGTILAKTGFLTSETLAGLSRLTYWVGLPCLLFQKIATTDFLGREAGPIFIAVVLTMFVVILFGYLLSALLRLGRNQRGAFVQASFRGNLAFVGLPVLLYASHNLAPESAHQFERLAVFAIAPIVPIYNACSILVLLVGHKKLDAVGVKHLLLQIVLNPLLLASIGASIVSLMGWPLPVMINRTTLSIGQMSLPLALITIGGSLAQRSTGTKLKVASIPALLKVAVTPLLGWLIAKALGLGHTEMRIAMTFMACPTAAACYILTEQLGGDKELAGGAVLISTLLSLASLTIVSAFF